MSAQQLAATFVLLLIGVVLCAAQTSGGIFSVATVVGDSVDKALNAFNGISEEIISRVYVDVSNYAKYPLSSPHHKMIHGHTLQAPGLVLPGYKEAWSAKLTVFEDIEVEGLSAWTTTHERFCFVYFRVPYALEFSDPNELAIECVTTNYTLNYILEMIETVKKSSNWTTDKMAYHVYDDNLPTIQHCDQFTCVQATMTSSFKCKVSWSFFPRKVSDLAPMFLNGTTQKQLDNILYQGNHCKLGCGGAAANYISPLAVTLVAAMFVF